MLGRIVVEVRYSNGVPAAGMAVEGVDGLWRWYRGQTDGAGRLVLAVVSEEVQTWRVNGAQVQPVGIWPADEGAGRRVVLVIPQQTGGGS